MLDFYVVVPAFPVGVSSIGVSSVSIGRMHGLPVVEGGCFAPIGQAIVGGLSVLR